MSHVARAVTLDRHGPGPAPVASRTGASRGVGEDRGWRRAASGATLDGRGITHFAEGAASPMPEPARRLPAPCASREPRGHDLVDDGARSVGDHRLAVSPTMSCMSRWSTDMTQFLRPGHLRQLGRAVPGKRPSRPASAVAGGRARALQNLNIALKDAAMAAPTHQRQLPPRALSPETQCARTQPRRRRTQALGDLRLLAHAVDGDTYTDPAATSTSAATPNRRRGASSPNSNAADIPSPSKMQRRDDRASTRATRSTGAAELSA